MPDNTGNAPENHPRTAYFIGLDGETRKFTPHPAPTLPAGFTPPKLDDVSAAAIERAISDDNTAQEWTALEPQEATDQLRRAQEIAAARKQRFGADLDDDAEDPLIMVLHDETSAVLAAAGYLDPRGAAARGTTGTDLHRALFLAARKRDFVVVVQTAGQLDNLPVSPYVVHTTGLIARQEVLRGDPFRLVGFQSDLDVERVDLDHEDFIVDPEQAVGMYPVFTREDGSQCTLDEPVQSVQVEEL